MRPIRYLIPVLYLLCLAPACRWADEIDRLQAPDWQPELALPLVNTAFTLGDLLHAWGESQWIETDATGLISLVYEDQLMEATWPELLALPNRVIPMPDTLLRLPMVLPGIDLIQLKAGRLHYTITTGTQEPVTVRLELTPLASPAGPFVQTLTLSGTGVQGGSFSLAGHTWQPEDGTLSFRYQARGSDGAIVPLQSCSFELQDLAYDYAEGYFGQFTFSLGADSIGVDVGSNLTLEGLTLADPKVRFTVSNSYGIPIRIDANDLTVVSPRGGVTTFSMGDSLPVAYPSRAEVGMTRVTTTEINRDNSAIVPALQAGISSLSWAFAAVTHPGGPTAAPGFILDTSRLAIRLGVEVPLYGRVESCRLTERVEVDFSDLQTGPFASGQLKLRVSNGFPFDLGVQVRFLDGEGGRLDSLFTTGGPLLPAAPVDAAGLVTAAAPAEHLIDLPAERLASLPLTRYLEVTATLATTAGGQVPVKLTETCGLGLQLGLITGF